MCFRRVFVFVFFSGGEFDPERKRKREAGGSLSTEPLRREERGFLQEQKGKNIKIEGVKGNGEIVHILGEKERDRVVTLTRVYVVIFIGDGKLNFLLFLRTQCSWRDMQLCTCSTRLPSC